MAIRECVDITELFDEIHFRLFSLKEEDTNPDNEKTWRELHILLSEAMRRSTESCVDVEPLELVEEAI
mgnify:CR=1 FL=1